MCAAFMFFTTLLVITLRLLLVYENRKLDRDFGTLEQQRPAAGGAEKAGAGDGGATALENYGPLFRYVL